ncbi:autophagy protein 12-like [Palaemon carinicauda]|uniref:autophagy protein 12-like n=1 Tax=Palaemon carinicauda TaxID=392227 RepID=UPI0035B5A60B
MEEAKKESSSGETTTETQEQTEQQDVKEAANKKIDVLLKATGDAPIMKKKKWAVEGDKPVGWVAEFIRKYLKLEPSESLFVYVNQCFAPAPDQIIRNLYECFGSDGKLVLHYCKTQAWG